MLQRGYLVDAPLSITAHSTVGSAEAFSLATWSGGQVLLPAAFTPAHLYVYTSKSKDGTYQQLYDEDGNAVEVGGAGGVTQGRNYQLPSACFGSRWAKLVADTSSGVVDVNLAG